MLDTKPGRGLSPPRSIRRSRAPYPLPPSSGRCGGGDGQDLTAVRRLGEVGIHGGVAGIDDRRHSLGRQVEFQEALSLGGEPADQVLVLVDHILVMSSKQRLSHGPQPEHRLGQ
jgi:hypothetical protein